MWTVIFISQAPFGVQKIYLTQNNHNEFKHNLLFWDLNRTRAVSQRARNLLCTIFFCIGPLHSLGPERGSIILISFSKSGNLLDTDLPHLLMKICGDQEFLSDKFACICLLTLQRSLNLFLTQKYFLMTGNNNYACPQLCIEP